MSTTAQRLSRNEANDRSRGRGRPWLSDDGVPYPHDQPNYYDPARHAFVSRVEAQWTVIRDELLAAIGEDRRIQEFKAYEDLEKTNKTAAWKTAGLMYWTMKSKKNIDKFPKTWDVFKDIPNLSSCSLHLLEPHGTIKEHIGDTDAMMRCHMGLIVPAGLPRCGFRVEQESVAWEEGKVFIFNDACAHTAWNNTEHDRYVISFDIMRPEFARRRFWVAAQVLGKIQIEVLYQHVPWLRKYASANWIRDLLIVGCKLFWRAKIAVRHHVFGGRPS